MFFNPISNQIIFVIQSEEESWHRMRSQAQVYRLPLLECRALPGGAGAKPMAPQDAQLDRACSS